MSFSADAYLNEMGITSTLQPDREHVERRFGGGVRHGARSRRTRTTTSTQFADFMRATKAPPRDAALAATSDAVEGSQLFDAIGCNVCHVRTIITAPTEHADSTVAR